MFFYDNYKLHYKQLLIEEFIILFRFIIQQVQHSSISDSVTRLPQFLKLYFKINLNLQKQAQKQRNSIKKFATVVSWRLGA